MLSLNRTLKTGPYHRDGTPHTGNETIPHLWYESVKTAKKLADVGWYFNDEAEQLNGPYQSRKEACEALDKYADELLADSNIFINPNKR